MAITINRFGEPPRLVKMKQLSAKVDVHWDLVPSFLENMKRLLKKTPPSKTNILLIYNSQQEDESKKAKEAEEAAQHQTPSSSDSDDDDESSFFSFFRGGTSNNPTSQLQAATAPAKSILDEITSDLYPSPNVSPLSSTYAALTLFLLFPFRRMGMSSSASLPIKLQALVITLLHRYYIFLTYWLKLTKKYHL